MAIDNPQQTTIEIYKKHTQQHDKEEIVAPTRIFLGSQLAGGLSNQWFVGNTVLLCSLNCGFSLMLLRQDDENSRITSRINMKYPNNCLKIGIQIELTNCETRIENEDRKRESKERIKNENQKRE